MKKILKNLNPKIPILKINKLKDGRKNAASLPAGTNLQTMIDEVKKDFTASIFGFGTGPQ